MLGDQAKEQTNNAVQQGAAIRAPSISLPKGGGAIRGIGEKFAANPVTGTGSMSIPIATSPGRSGFGPQLALDYDSGAGSGPFGLGWNLSTPSITRKTDKGLPRYRDADDSDVFILSGAEDLVPVLVKVGNEWIREVLPPRTVDGREYAVQRYRPRIEGLFARIERWTNRVNAADVFWRSISRENITTWYGKTDESRISDPADSTRIFSWLICETSDDKGNVVAYVYKREDSAGIDLSQVHERNRTDLTRSANRYVKRIRYGNRVPYFQTLAPDQPLTPLPDKDGWMFEVVFDYGEHDADEPQPSDDPAGSNSRPWPVRNDPFSSYRAGFEVRTYRLCQRGLMFHHFPTEPGVGANCLVRSTDFTYSFEQAPADARNPIHSLLLSVTHRGYKRQPPDSPSEYLRKSLPPVEFKYSEATISDRLDEVDPESLENLPYGLDGANYQWIDLDGEGLPGILTEQADGWFYKRNLSPLPKPGGSDAPSVTARFAPVELVASKPAPTFAAGQAQFMDLAGDGQADLVQLDGPMRGFYERSLNADWISFRPFELCPNLDTRDPNLKFIDLDGDGHADVLITENEVFRWHASLGEAGFGPAEVVQQHEDEEEGPRLVFGNAEQSIYLADLSGDGLTDLVRIRNGEVCYWPNQGYGHFGSKVTMDNAPFYDEPDRFDQRRIRLADIDGSGVTDIIYLSGDGIRIFFNQSGNSWSQPQTLQTFPPIDDLTSVTVADLHGNGTACLVWSSRLAGDAGRPMRYLDLMGGQKPHLLLKTVNNLGAETIVSYAPSTKFYLADMLAGRPWITRLPFPVHVVERIETLDRVSRNRFVTRYAYHHGHFDGDEREFRGFGMIEQFDTEEFGALSAGGELDPAENIDASSHVPPVLIRTWFHTGVHIGRDHVSNFFAGLLDENDLGEYYREPGLTDEEAKAFLLDDTVLPIGLTADEEREACRAMKGSMLRQEVYALDGTEKEEHPFTVLEQSFTIQLVQPRADNRNAAFFTHAREALSSHYEREPADPRTGHMLTLEVDEFGNVLKSAAVAYGRRQPDVSLSAEDQARQTQTHVTYTEGEVTNPIAENDTYRTPLACEARTYELTGYSSSGAAGRFQASDLVEADANGRLRLIFDDEISYEEAAGSGSQRRLIERVRTLYRPDDFGDAANDPLALLPFGELEPLALPGETYKLAFTPGLLTQVYRRPKQNEPPENLLPDPVSVLPIDAAEGRTADRGGYVDLENEDHWWMPSGRVFYSRNVGDDPALELSEARQHFFLPRRYRDPFDQHTTIAYDHDLLLLETRDALGNTVLAENEYRVLQPRLVTDPNHNRVAAAFDALGMLAGTAVMGKPGEGDAITDLNADLTEAEVSAFVADPLGHAADMLNGATTRMVYDLDRFMRDGQPAVAATLARETHVSDLLSGEESKIQVSLTYSDGFGREIQRKIQAEPGPVPKRDPDGNIVVGPDGQPEMTPNDVSPRWVGSGWTVFNNKDKPVRQYEPFFTDTHGFEFDVRIGVSPVLFYDPVERVVATLHPNHTWEKVVFDPWRQESWDVNDTVLVADPEEDDLAGDFFRRLPDEEYLPTWHAQREGGALGPQEQAAASKTAIHANTPSVAHFDALGRTFLTVAHNRFKRTDDIDPAAPPTEEFHATRMVYDIEGNDRAVIDALDRVVVRYDYDMLGNRIHQASMEAGERWMLTDVAGQAIRAWGSREHEFRTAYDELRRPIEFHLKAGAAPELLVGRTVYGETHPNPEASNLRGRVVQLFDQAGVFTSDDYDFKGNLRGSQRQLAQEYKTTLNWAASDAVPLETDILASRTAYDALNRPIELIAPDNSIIRPTYNEANLLERIEARLRDAAAITPFVTGIDYDSKGQRTRIEFGNGVRTIHEYDLDTFRLIHLTTTRGADALQDLRYTYDPVGNITHIRDDAQQTIYFRNKRVEPSADYTYDAVYWLIEATGREHLGQTGSQPNGPTVPDAFNAFHTRLDHPGDGNAMGTYVQRYLYDVVGNILEMQHQGSSPVHEGWTRDYFYEETSQIDPGVVNNRLTRTVVGGITERYRYDGSPGAHGNMTSMPHLPLMHWDFRDQLQATSQQVVNNGTPEITYYVYDGSGQRVRKVTERQAAVGQTPTRMKERIYLGAFEIFREYETGGESVELERETLHIMDDRQRIALVETRTHGTDPAPAQVIRFQFGNHLGSASLELDGNGQIVTYEEYFPYGSSSYQAVRNRTETPKRYRYTAKERDEESGFYYHGARHYAPWLGRWTNADPAGLVDRTNLYWYAKTNPLRFVDSSGHDSVEVVEAMSETRQFTIYKTDFLEVTFRVQVDGEIINIRNFYLRNNLFDKDFRSVSEWGFQSAARVSGDLDRASLAQLQRLERASEAMGEFLYVGAGYMAIALAPLIAGETTVLGLAKAGFYAETSADVVQAGVAAADAVQNPTPQNIAAAGVALGDVFLGPTPGAELVTASRKERGVANSVPNNDAVGEFTAARPPRRHTSLGGQLVQPLKDAKSWPSRTVRVHRSADIGVRPHIPAAATRAIEAKGPVDPIGPYDRGHITGHEAWRKQRSVRAGEISRDEFVESQQDPNIYQLENQRLNRSHAREKKD